MQLKNKLTFLFLFLFSSGVFALPHLTKGVHFFEGKILIDKENVYLAINHGSNSEVKIKLSGDTTLLKGQNYSNAELKIEVSKDSLASSSEAKFIEVKRFLHPNEDVKIYLE